MHSEITGSLLGVCNAAHNMKKKNKKTQQQQQQHHHKERTLYLETFIILKGEENI